MSRESSPLEAEQSYVAQVIMAATILPRLLLKSLYHASWDRFLLGGPLLSGLLAFPKSDETQDIVVNTHLCKGIAFGFTAIRRSAKCCAAIADGRPKPKRVPRYSLPVVSDTNAPSDQMPILSCPVA